MEDRLIFPTSLEQVGTGQLIHENFPKCKWTTVHEYTSPYASPEYYISDIELDISPMLFFEWAYRTPAGCGSVLFYCLNLSFQFIMEPADWMIGVVNQINQKKLTTGL